MTASARPPNIVFILADDLGWADLSVYGQTDFETPNLDRFAAQGITYLEARAVAPITLPSHASMLTGLWPPRHGVRMNALRPLPSSARTLAEIASDAGVDTEIGTDIQVQSFAAPIDVFLIADRRADDGIAD